MLKEGNIGSHSKIKVAGLLIAMGVVYGDIGTSPLYVMKAIIEGNGGLENVSSDFIIGAVSLVIWTVTLLTTVKYVMIALKADNHGEGGIFSLYTLVRRSAKYLMIPAMIGGATLLADGVLTPAVTITTAVEGLRGIPVFFNKFGNNQNIIVGITVAIIFMLFGIQRFGTEKVGRAFGPIMFGWFTFIGGIGLLNFLGDVSVIRAINPYYAIQLLMSPENKAGLFILGSVFLATTGAEALYSDMGHVGRTNILQSWPYIKVCLIMNYLGQAAWIISIKDDATFQAIDSLNPFFRMIPESLSIFSVIFATVAAIIASQSLISGSYTLVSEAIKLHLFPKLKIIYPTNKKGQLYIPSLNWVLCALCIGIVLAFRTSAHLEAAYGLAITITMLMTTILLFSYLIQKKVNKIFAICFLVFFATLESIFLISSATKFFHGGYVAILIAVVILCVMTIWEKGHLIKERVLQRIDLSQFVDQLVALSHDETIPLFQTNVVYLTDNLRGHRIGREILYSILDKKPKKAHVYWLVNVYVTDEPYTKEYMVDMMGTDCVVNLQLKLGFRMRQDVNRYIRQIVNELMAQGLIKEQPQKYTIAPGRKVGDFCFVIIKQEMSRVSTGLSQFERVIYQLKLAISSVTTSRADWYGLEYSDVVTESVPLILEIDCHNMKPLTQVISGDFHSEDDEEDLD